MPKGCQTSLSSEAKGLTLSTWPDIYIRTGNTPPSMAILPAHPYASKQLKWPVFYENF